MDIQTKKGAKGELWNKITGDPGELSMENRAFNYVCVVTAVLLAYFLAFDIYSPQHLMAVILAVLLVVVGILYYYSRFKKRYGFGTVVYAFISYALLVFNYYINSGLNGPTIYLFFLTLQVLIVISKPRFYPLWIALHFIAITGIMVSEYLHPEWVPNTYPSRLARYIDIGVTNTAALASIFLITNFLTRHLKSAKLAAEEKEHTTAELNREIIAQNQALEKVNEEKDKLFSIISHDLRSPLDSIRGYLELISEHLLDESELANIHEELLNQTRYTSELLLNLLYWSKTQMQGISAHVTSIRLKEVVEEVSGNKLPMAAKKMIKITHSIKPEIEVIADKDMLRIVLRNLVNNAIKFTREGGEIFVKAAIRELDVVISVQDTGIGIPADRRDEIFGQKTGSTYGTNNEKGIGLGLRLCKEFVEYMHGAIWFDSTEGKGSTFYVRLPMARR